MPWALSVIDRSTSDRISVRLRSCNGRTIPCECRNGAQRVFLKKKNHDPRESELLQLAFAIPLHVASDLIT